VIGFWVSWFEHSGLSSGFEHPGLSKMAKTY
jgi:hypothetical protein